MDTQFALGEELRRLVESRIGSYVEGDRGNASAHNERTGNRSRRLEEIFRVEESFSLFSQKWNLEILYTLFLKNATNFSQLKKILVVNSRTLSDKLKSLATSGCVQRRVKTGPPLRVEYVLTERGKNVVLLALPLLYYSRAYPRPQLGSPDKADQRVSSR